MHVQGLFEEIDEASDMELPPLAWQFKINRVEPNCWPEDVEFRCVCTKDWGTHDISSLDVLFPISAPRWCGTLKT